MTPRIAETAKGLAGLSRHLAGAVHPGLPLAGMDWFDALCHTFRRVAGRFSTHDASIGHFASAQVRYVAIFFMLISGINYATHFWRSERAPLRPHCMIR